MKTLDILHHYVGAAHCEYVFNHLRATKSNRVERKLLTLNTVRMFHFREIKRLRLILRPLHTMTTDEYREYVRIEEDEMFTSSSTAPEIQSRAFSPITLVFLLSRGFDLFRLIDSGEAIDATKLEENPYLCSTNTSSAS